MLYGAWTVRCAAHALCFSNCAIFNVSAAQAALGIRMDLISALEGLVPELEKGLDQASSLEGLEALRVDFLGRKGRIAQIMSQLPKLEPEQRPAVGQTANSVKERCNDLFDARKQALEAGREAEALKRFDPSIPGRAPWSGTLHPTTLVMEEICEIFKGLGFEIVSGPEVEIDYYNFEALNMPPEHPARDMQDTLYITDKVLKALNAAAK